MGLAKGLPTWTPEIHGNIDLIGGGKGGVVKGDFLRSTLQYSWKFREMVEFGPKLIGEHSLHIPSGSANLASSKVGTHHTCPIARRFNADRPPRNVTKKRERRKKRTTRQGVSLVNLKSQMMPSA